MRVWMIASPAMNWWHVQGGPSLCPMMLRPCTGLVVHNGWMASVWWAKLVQYEQPMIMWLLLCGYVLHPLTVAIMHQKAVWQPSKRKNKRVWYTCRLSRRTLHRAEPNDIQYIVKNAYWHLQMASWLQPTIRNSKTFSLHFIYKTSSNSWHLRRLKDWVYYSIIKITVD